MGGTDTADEHKNKQKRQKSTLSRFFRYQKPMVKMAHALLPVVAMAVFLFGWRSLAVVAVCTLVAVGVEWLFCRTRGEPVSSAVFVTAILYALTLPPGVPWLVILVGIVVAIMFGKEVFGGFGRNVFNPALVGRAFVYVSFPRYMTQYWAHPFSVLPRGFARWTARIVDATSAATPLRAFKMGEAADYTDMFFGFTGGSMGETSALLILLCGLYLVKTRAANWRIPVATLVGAALAAVVFRMAGAKGQVADPLYQILAGGMMFGAFFMATDPVSAPMNDESRWIFGLGIGLVAVVIRGFGQFYCGVMFAILFMNMFCPIMDHYVVSIRKWRKALAEARESAEGVAS